MAWAEWIAWVLEEDGHKVLVQAWDFVPGSNWIQSMQAGAARAARTIAVLSPAYLESEYGTSRAGLRTMVSSAIAGRAKPGTAPRFPGGRAMPREPRFPGGLPGAWKVPARDPNFTGRGGDLAGLAASLAIGSTVTVQSLRGMGGVGKTQLATEFAHAHAGDYDLVYWIAAEEPATIPYQFTALAGLLGLDPAADPEILQAQVHDQLRSVPAGCWSSITPTRPRTCGPGCRAARCRRGFPGT